MRTHREMMLSLLAPYDGEDDLVRWSSAAKEGNDGSKAQIAWLIMQSTHLWERTKLFWTRERRLDDEAAREMDTFGGESIEKEKDR